MKVLGICGSPRPGNSQYLLEIALDEAKAAGERFGVKIETDFWSVRGKKLSGCVACGKCENTGACIIRDDFAEIQGKWLEADVVLYSVPVYHMSMPAQLKAFIDRLGNSYFGLFASKFPEGTEATLPKSLKIVGCIAQGCHVFSGQEHTITDLVNHALLMGCIPVTGDMWQTYIGAGGWTCNDVSRTAVRDQLQNGGQDAQIVTQGTRTIARRAVEIAAILQSGGREMLGVLKKEPVYIPFVENL